MYNRSVLQDNDNCLSSLNLKFTGYGLHFECVLPTNSRKKIKKTNLIH